MKIERKGETVVEVNSIVRVQETHVRRREIATKDLLSDEVTATHYYAGTRDFEEGGKIIKKVGVDALGKPIKIGEPMDFIDWKSKERVFQIYALDKDGVWQPKGEPHADYETALGAAIALAGK